MSISLPTNKEEKRKRLIMLVKQDSLTVIQGNKLYQDYCRLYDRCIIIGELSEKHLE